MNYLAMEAFWQLTDICRGNFIALMNDLLRWRMSKIEIVVANTVKAFIEFGSLNTRFQQLVEILRFLKPFTDFLFQESRDAAFVTGCILNVCTYFVVEIRQCNPETRDDIKKQILQFLEFVVTTYFPQVQALAGREFMYDFDLFFLLLKIDNF